MKKAFVSSKKKDKKGVVAFLLPILFFLLVAIVVIVGINNVSTSSDEEQLRIMEQGIRRSAVQAYAIEGAYPTNLDYLAKHYGLLLDKEKYVYHYNSVGSNIMPDISVFVAS